MSQQDNTGAFVPNTFMSDASEIFNIDINSDSFKDMFVRLYQNLNLIQQTLNIKDSAYYDTNEFVNGQSFFAGANASSFGSQAVNRRQVFRKIINFGALPNTAAKSVAHEIPITSGYTFTRIYGASSDTTNKAFTPLPNASTDINLRVDATNVIITTGGNFASYDTTYVILEYLKQ